MEETAGCCAQGDVTGGYTLHIKDTEGTLIEDTARRYTQGKEASYPQWTIKKGKEIFLIYKEIQKGSGAK
jgi:hypothetical protein